MWTKNFQMFKLVLEKAEEPEIKLPSKWSVGSLKKQATSRKTSTSALLTMSKPLTCVDHNKLWKILQEMGILDHLTCLLRNLYAGQEATVRIGHGTTHWFQIGKRVHQGCISYPAYLTYIQSECEMLGWMKHKVESRLLREISITSDIQMIPPLWSRTKNPLDKSESGQWKSWLKAQHSENLRSWHLVPSLHGKWMGKQWKQCQTLFFWAPKSLQMVTAAMKFLRHLLLGRKVMTNLDSTLKSRDITLSTKVHLVKAMIFPVVMYGCETWTVKKAEYWRIDVFELWCWRWLLRLPWTARRSNQSILKEISSGYLLDGLMLKLKFQHFGYLMQRDDSFVKILTLGKMEDKRRRGQQRMR